MTAGQDGARAEAHAVLEAAARAALRAPSVHNTQPWRWRITGDVLELWSDPARRLDATDAEGRLLLLSCGGALHHARVALAARGRPARVDRLPDAGRPDLLARIRPTGPVAPDPAAARLAAAIIRRRTDRRAFGGRRLTPGETRRLDALVEAAGAHLYAVPDDRVPELAVAVDEAADAEYFSAAHRGELTRWTHRPAWTGDGVAPRTAVAPGHRRVPVRNLLPSGSPGLPAGTGADEGAVYTILYGDGDAPLDLLRGGEAMSALLLGATADGVSSAPLSEPVEVSRPRRLLRRLLPDGGEPFLVVRLGHPGGEEPPPASPRREPGEMITLDDPE